MLSGENTEGVVAFLVQTEYRRLEEEERHREALGRSRSLGLGLLLFALPFDVFCFWLLMGELMK